MPSFNGTISYEGKQPFDTEVQEAIRLANITRTLKEATGLPRIIKAYDMIDGGQVYVLDMENTWRVHIVSPYPIRNEAVKLVGPLSDSGTPRIPIAGILSGAAFGTTIEDKAVSWPDVGQEDQEAEMAGVPYGEVPTIVADAFELVSESSELFPKDQASYKLAVPLDTIFSTVGDIKRRNQFHRVIPGQYTGAMAPIVQLLLGVGNIVFPDYEDRWLDADEDRTGLYPSQIAELGSTFQYGEYGVVEETGEVIDSSGMVSADGVEIPDSIFFDRGGQIQIDYDYRWNRTHGIMWGTGNDAEGEEPKPKPMLVELAQRGIHVMPFPVDELSTNKAVQDHYERVYPKLAQYTPFQGGTTTLFEAFNGFPTGEKIPGYHVDFERWKRAGKVIASQQDLSKFYDGGIAMCTGFGWAFHPTQPRAINTGYRYEDDHKMGYCYQVDLKIVEKSEEDKVRNPFLAATIAALNLTEEIDIFKAVRLPEDFAEDMIDNPDYDAFDAFEVDPDWTVTASVRKVSEGIIDYSGYQCPRFEDCDVIFSPHFKYFEPLIGQVLNFFFVNELVRDEGRQYVADGPIFATYRDSGVEILNYYYDTAAAPGPENVNTRQPCQYSGSWETGSRTEGSKLQGYFYCTSKDFRELLPAGGSNITTHRAKLSGDADFIAFCAFFGVQSTSSKHFFGTETWESERWSSLRHLTSATAAANNRSAFLICKEQITSEKITGEGFSGIQFWGTSGTIKRGTIRNWLWHWVGCMPWGCPSEDDGCVHRNCFTITNNPESCFGVKPPSDIQYAVCPYSINQGRGPYSIVSPVKDEEGNGAVIVSAYYTPVPTAPPAYSKFSDPRWEFDWEVWAFGLDLMNNRKINEGNEVITNFADLPRTSSYTGWWRCSLDKCPAPLWLVGQNFFGKPFVSAYDDLDPKTAVDFGAKLSIGFGPMSTPFGILD